MPRIGLTGTFGSGKSTVARMFERCGAAVIDADRLAHEAVEPGRPALARIAEEFGSEYILGDGSLDRKRMAETVFSSPERREALNEIVHPRVIEEMHRLARELERGEGPSGVVPPMIVLNVPLLLERGLEKGLDKVAVVTIDESERIARVGRRDALSEEEIAQRVAAQWPQERKAAMADAVIDNSGPLDATRRQVEALYARWVKG
ncbi:dephospho-CoA kinase [Candidatus Sumerlaeota bacterium]|nr:dephospho-CoA kinase [Candidatus Sumerlaeota bacterium]